MSKLRKETREHYERLKACREWGDFMLEGWNCHYCPLCLHYLGADLEGSCDGCPVRRATGCDSCLGSPWDAMHKAITAKDHYWADPNPEPLAEVVKMAEWLEAIDWEGQP